MNPSNRKLKCHGRNELLKDVKVKQNIIEILRWNDAQIANRQSWVFTCMHTINNFITHEYNSYRVETSFFKMDGKKDGIKW